MGQTPKNFEKIVTGHLETKQVNRGELLSLAQIEERSADGSQPTTSMKLKQID